MENGAGGPGEAAAVDNRELDGLEAELQQLVAAGRADGFLLYLLGLVLADRCGWQAAERAPLCMRHILPSCPGWPFLVVLG